MQNNQLLEHNAKGYSSKKHFFEKKKTKKYVSPLRGILSFTLLYIEFYGSNADVYYYNCLILRGYALI